MGDDYRVQEKQRLVPMALCAPCCNASLVLLSVAQCTIVITVPSHQYHHITSVPSHHISAITSVPSHQCHRVCCVWPCGDSPSWSARLSGAPSQVEWAMQTCPTKSPATIQARCHCSSTPLWLAELQDPAAWPPCSILPCKQHARPGGIYKSTKGPPWLCVVLAGPPCLLLRRRQPRPV